MEIIDDLKKAGFNPKMGPNFRIHLSLKSLHGAPFSAMFSLQDGTLFLVNHITKEAIPLAVINNKGVVTRSRLISDVVEDNIDSKAAVKEYKELLSIISLNVRSGNMAVAAPIGDIVTKRIEDDWLSDVEQESKHKKSGGKGDWFSLLTPKQQKDYTKKHPHSKYSKSTPPPVPTTAASKIKSSIYKSKDKPFATIEHNNNGTTMVVMYEGDETWLFKVKGEKDRKVKGIKYAMEYVYNMLDYGPSFGNAIINLLRTLQDLTE